MICVYKGEDGETALLLAASRGHHDIVKLLIECGSNPNHVDHVSTKNTENMILEYI